MTVILVVTMFALFITLDYLMERRSANAERVEAVRRPAAEPTLPAFAAEPIWVAGYQLPETLHYHRGHTWARVIGRDTVLVGLDDFARQLLGTVGKIRLPAVGDAVWQGSAGFTASDDGRAADLVSPVDGQVVEVNRELAAHPSLIAEDPYGRGWVMKVRSLDLARSLRNLLTGSLARHWMEDTRERLEHRLVALSGSVLQDGGAPVSDFASHLPREDWERLVAEFLLT